MNDEFINRMKISKQRDPYICPLMNLIHYILLSGFSFENILGCFIYFRFLLQFLHFQFQKVIIYASSQVVVESIISLASFN